MIIRNSEIVKHGFLSLPEVGDYTEQVKFLGGYIDWQFTQQRQVDFVCSKSSYLQVWSIHDQVKTSVQLS